MQTLAIAVGALILYLIAYHTYGKFLARRIFKLDPETTVPSIELRDDIDYVPTKKSIIFGHHFTSIAGTGPIVGPAIAVMWGWLPALIWVLVGSILIGAVHDFGALVVSLRNRGQTVGDIAGRVLNPRVRMLFLLILFLALTIVLAIFGLVIAKVFQQYPQTIFPCLVEIPIAVLIGLALHRKGIDLLLPSLLALGCMYLSVIYGGIGILGDVNTWLSELPVMSWVVLLLLYSYVASVLPVWVLLQPRDYINSHQLLTALGLVVAGLFAAAIFGGAAVDGVRPPLEMVAPAIDLAPQGAPMIFPFLFVTIACGAISGFHCLVSSGTSSKQLKCETDAQFVGYGSMLTEGFLATLVILACCAGMGLGIENQQTGATLLGETAWNSRYASWGAAQGLGDKVAAFVDGSANFLKALGISEGIATALMGVLVASFAATTLDTACRLQRYVVQELAGTFRRDGENPGILAVPANLLSNKHGATIFAIVLAGAMAALPVGGATWEWGSAGKGGLILWPLFGATNQLLAGLAFLVISFWLWRRKLPVVFVALPMVFMLIIPAWALISQLGGFLGSTGAEANWLLVSVALATLALQAWMLLEAVLLWPRARGIIEDSLPPLPARSEPHDEGGRSC
ncbi:MAG: carbon starvation protein A [Verrucomicrobiaceae bacterium]|nr:carbon starvation protein A [Verrucomicrobiaceae bacterium]